MKIVYKGGRLQFKVFRESLSEQKYIEVWVRGHWKMVSMENNPKK